MSDPRGTRTASAIDWLLAKPAPGEPKRTQEQAAALFGIRQPTIAAGIARRRQSCSACGQKLKQVAGWVSRPRTDAAEHQADDVRLAQLAQAIRSYAWHLGDCPAYETGAGACSCGFATAESVARGVIGG